MVRKKVEGLCTLPARCLSFQSQDDLSCLGRLAKSLWNMGKAFSSEEYGCLC